jgi:hypothetical protein
VLWLPEIIDSGYSGGTAPESHRISLFHLRVSLEDRHNKTGFKEPLSNGSMALFLPEKHVSLRE